MSDVSWRAALSVFATLVACLTGFASGLAAGAAGAG
jgi:hypothetical protein